MVNREERVSRKEWNMNCEPMRASSIQLVVGVPLFPLRYYNVTIIRCFYACHCCRQRRRCRRTMIRIRAIRLDAVDIGLTESYTHVFS